MKNMKKIVALLLAAVMLLCFAGCAKENGEAGSAALSDEERIVGSWGCEIDLTDYMNENMGSLGVEGFEMSDDPLYIYMNFDFEDDGTCALYLDEDKTLDSMTTYIEAMMDALVEYMYVMMEEEGMSRSEVDEMFETYYGMSLADYFEEAMAEELTPEALAESFEDVESGEGYYKLDDGKLYVADTEEELAETEDYVTYTFEGDTLKIDSGSDNSSFEDLEDLGVELPLVFEKN